MPAMTYTSLVNQVTDYIDRDDTDTLNEVPNFIYQAQQNLALACKTILVESYIVGNFITGTSVYQKPANWRRNVSMNVGSVGPNFNTRNPVLLRPYEFLRMYTPDSADATKRALPQFYSDYGYTNFLVAPTPDQNYPFEYCFLQIPAVISQDNQTNYWTNFAPQLLLNATLVEAMSFLKNDDRIQVFKAAMQEGIDLINKQDDMRIVDRSTARQSD